MTSITPLNCDDGIKPLIGSSFVSNEFFLKDRADHLTRIFGQVSEKHVVLSTSGRQVTLTLPRLKSRAVGWGEEGQSYLRYSAIGSYTRLAAL